MKDTALFFLHKVAKTTNNVFAIALFNRLNNADKDVNLEVWKLLDVLSDEKESLGELTDNRIGRNQDYRFLRLYLKGFRKFPFDKFHGVPFCSKQEEFSCPHSVLIQGSNGSGKTSVFSALEYLFTGQISAAKKQRLDEKEIKDSIPYSKKDINEVLINVTTKSKSFSFGPNEQFQSDLGRLSLYPFFCSEYDVDNLLEKRLTGYIFNQMGYGLTRDIIVKLRKEIEKIISDIEEHGELQTLNDIDAQIDDLNRKKKYYERCKNYFLEIVYRLQGEQDYNNYLKEIITELSKKYIYSGDNEGLSDDMKLLNEETLKKEKELIDLSRRDNVSIYSQIEKKLQSNLENPDLLVSEIETGDIVTEKVKKDELDDFNNVRSSLKEIIEMILLKKEDDNSEFVLPDFDSCVDKLNMILKDIKDEIKNEDVSKNMLLEFNKSYEKYTKYKDIFDSFLKDFETEVYGILGRITDNFRNFVEDEEIASLFLVDDEKMYFDFNKDLGDFVMGIKMKNPDNDLASNFAPREYLNTFRYKLYCMTLKFVIAFTIKKFYGINFPIVIDDIFYSSDFSHRNKVRDYFRTLFKKHDELFPNEDQKLQVIFFSHDEVVIEAAYRGIRDVTPNVDRLLLYDYRDAGDNDDVTISVNQDKITYTKLTDSLDI